MTFPLFYSQEDYDAHQEELAYDWNARFDYQSELAAEHYDWAEDAEDYYPQDDEVQQNAHYLLWLIQPALKDPDWMPW